MAGNEPMDDDSVIRDVEFWIEGILISICATFGLIGNSVCLTVLIRNDVELKPAFANLLKCLTVFESLFLVCILTQYSGGGLCDYYSTWILPYLVPYTHPLLHVCLTASVYTVVAVAVERVVTVTFPFKQIKMHKGMVYIFPIVLFSSVYNIPKFLELETALIDIEIWETSHTGNNTSHVVQYPGSNYSHVVQYPVVNATQLRLHPLYPGTTIFLLNLFIMGLIPLLVLSCLNYIIYRAIWSATTAHMRLNPNSRREMTMSGVLLGIVMSFFICHTPKILINSYEAFLIFTEEESLLDAPPSWLIIAIKVNHFLLTINCSINILIYFFKDIRFRTLIIAFFMREKAQHRNPSRPSSMSKNSQRLRCYRYSQAGTRGTVIHPTSTTENKRPDIDIC